MLLFYEKSLLSILVICSHPFDTLTVVISITTANGHPVQANLSTAGGLPYTFNIPENQGKSVQVCVKPGNLSINNCHTYETTGSDMSVSLPPPPFLVTRHRCLDIILLLYSKIVFVFVIPPHFSREYN